MYSGSHSRAISHSGYIGLKGDSEKIPKRSFFWFFEAQNGNKSAPLILTIGGGPGVSGLLNPLTGQSHCRLTSNATTEPNSYAWTEKFNLVALDHPVNVGFSYGTRVNNSRDAAYDVYDFLQKFFVLFPHLLMNPPTPSGGSYGGTYIPHIATVIHESNVAIASGIAPYKARRINLESMMLSNPHTDALSHYTWTLHHRCTLTDLYNATVCSTFYARLPFCLDAIRLVYEDSSVKEGRVEANRVCQETQLQKLEGRAYENVNIRCNGTMSSCFPETDWLNTFLNNPSTKHKLGVPPERNFSTVNQDVHRDFIEAGDIVQPAHLLYPPLLDAGIRLLHYVGKLDANCPWPGTLSMLNLLRTPLQPIFLATPDIPWEGENATVRVVPHPPPPGFGEGARGGAGKLTYIAMEDSGHIVVKDQPALVKKIVER
ncbi:Alpha/Beta hydrolase protein [Irpex rosettiformis]|uniref:Alpha/Beta hydrolase protein n=1 Tax=Irpex rosettiformis TaxID=378272 RepID=A0ACB8U8N8_9APHY|nr:Alpha/Beta hydrolase protein [Irpex rosettiformis]